MLYGFSFSCPTRLLQVLGFLDEVWDAQAYAAGQDLARVRDVTGLEIKPDD